MSDSDLDFDPGAESEEECKSYSRRPSTKPISSRKRRRQSRSSSVESESKPDIRRNLLGHYRDDYRKLLNDNIESAGSRFNPPDGFHPRKTQLGASEWTPAEKTKFFAALERLGRDDIPAIAKAIGSKSIPEVRQYLLLLDEKSATQTRVTLRDIPAAAEISQECNSRLDLAGEALAWYQEKHEAKKEQERYGAYWLITPAIAEEIENAQTSSRRQSVASSLPPQVEVDADAQAGEGVPTAQILRDIPEAQLLVPSVFLDLSMNVFMNGSSNPPSKNPHWSALASPLASKPSIYRTALNDFHTLTVSLTRRLVQASIIQATSRIRSQGWRVKKGVNPLVKKRDVVAAIDMLRMQRDGKERWVGAARRCGLRVVEGRARNPREMDWKEVEEILGSFRKLQDLDLSGGETPEPASGAEDDNLKRRAARSGTPLPSHDAMQIESDPEYESETIYLSDISDDGVPPIDRTTPSSQGTPGPTQEEDLSEEELQTLEEYDSRASKKEEHRLLAILDNQTIPDATDVEVKEEKLDALSLRVAHNRNTTKDGWREWTEYRAEWEEFATPVSPSMFVANQRSPSPAPLPSVEHDNADTEAESGLSSGLEGRRRGTRRRKKRKVIETEIPIRGARAYAALQDRMSGSEGRQSVQEGSAGDDAQWAVPSIEDPIAGALEGLTASEDEM